MENILHILPFYHSNSIPQVFIAYLLHVKVKVTQSCLTLRPHGLYSPWNSPGQNAGVGSLSLLQEIFPTQGLNPGLLHYREGCPCQDPQENGKKCTRRRLGSACFSVQRTSTCASVNKRENYHSIFQVSVEAKHV